MNMKETTKAIIGSIGIISLLAMAVFTRNCGPKGKS
jgi:hypothetical protein